MKIYRQLFIILCFSFIGEMVSKGFDLPVPGSVIGMVLLFLALQFKLLDVKSVEKAGNFLLSNLSLLFVPASVGIMVYFPLIKENWWILLIILLLTSGFTLIFVGLLVQKIKRKFEEHPSGNHKKRKAVVEHGTRINK
ncbi:MAG: CidA/LrgA family protein [Carnobacterium sp.]|uniref:CidA/LrgA family protein n=1 Tax=Carnobacterium sp. TaxID=48221 RepID=UPI002FC69CA0